MRKKIFSPDAPRNQTLYGNHSPNGPPVGAAYMPPAHPPSVAPQGPGMPGPPLCLYHSISPQMPLLKKIQKTFKNPIDIFGWTGYNIQAVTETRQHSRTLKIEQN